MEAINTSNDCFVGIHGDEILIMRPPLGPMPRDKALRLAAWLVALADPDGDNFDIILDAVLST